MTLNREQFLQAATGRKYVNVETSVGIIRLQSLTESERVTGIDLWLRPDGELDEDRKKDQRLRIVLLCAVDDQGERLFTEGDMAELRKIPASVVSQVCEVGMALCGLGGEEELAGKLNSSEDAPSGNSS